MNDYKPRPKAKRTGSWGNTLVGIFIGLLLGLLIAAAIAIYMSKSPFPFSQQKPKPLPPDAGPAASQKKAEVAAVDKGEKSRFDFYKILPGKEEATPRPADPRAETPRPDPQAAAKSAPGRGETFMLQVGSYQNPSEADNQKARLALLGLEASVEPADLPDRGTWYRVRLGPFKSLSEVNHVRSQLAQNGLEATLVKGTN